MKHAEGRGGEPARPPLVVVRLGGAYRRRLATSRRARGLRDQAGVGVGSLSPLRSKRRPYCAKQARPARARRPSRARQPPRSGVLNAPRRRCTRSAAVLDEVRPFEPGVHAPKTCSNGGPKVLANTGPRRARRDSPKPHVCDACVEGRQEECPSAVDGKPGRAFCSCASREDEDRPSPVHGRRLAAPLPW